MNKNTLFIMKRFLSAIFIFAVGLMTFPVWGDNIPITGEWGTPGGLRSSVPAPPEGSIEGNTLSIYFPSALANLSYCIMDMNGDVIYKETISSNGSDYTYDSPWVGTPGSYQLLIIHTYGHLGGAFCIE